MAASKRQALARSYLMKMAFFEYSVSSRFLILARFASFLDEKVNFHRKIAWQFLMHLGHWVPYIYIYYTFYHWLPCGGCQVAASRRQFFSLYHS